MWCLSNWHARRCLSKSKLQSQKWCSLLKLQTTMKMTARGETVYFCHNKIFKPIKLVKSRQIYWILNTKNITNPTCIQNWFSKYFIVFSENTWTYIFTLIKAITLNTKLIEFQFIILHQVYASDSYVSNFGNTVSKKCSQCHVDNNIPHFFVDCSKVKPFWILFKAWFANIDNSLPELNTPDIIFGILKYSCYLVNYWVIHAKWFYSSTKNRKP